MKFSALFIGSLVGTLVAVAAFALYDGFNPSFFFTNSLRLIVFPLLVGGAQAFFLTLPGILVLNGFGRLNLYTAILCGALSAGLPWLFIARGTDGALFFAALIAGFGAIGGLVGYITARAVSPNNSFKARPLRGPP